MENCFILNNALIIDPEVQDPFLGAIEIKDSVISKVYKSPKCSKVKTISSSV